MATPRDLAVTEYVRWRMRTIIDSKESGTQQQIAQRIGISPAMLSSLWKTGVGGKSIDGFAKFLGFKDAEALRNAAYDWYREQSPRTESRFDEPAVKAAVEKICKLQPWVLEAQIRTILHRFAHSDFDDRDQDYWFMAIASEIQQDTLREQRRKIEQQTQRAEREREQREIQGAFRSAAAVKRQEAARVAELAAVPPPAIETPERKRKKA